MESSLVKRNAHGNVIFSFFLLFSVGYTRTIIGYNQKKTFFIVVKIKTNSLDIIMLYKLNWELIHVNFNIITQTNTNFFYGI